MSTRKIILSTIALHRMAGGLERNFIRLGNYLAAQGYDVHLVTFDTGDAVPFFEIDPRVSWHRTGETAPHRKIGFWERWRVIGRVRNILKGGPGTLIVFHHGILLRLLCASLFLHVRVICSERNSLSLYNHIRRGQWNLNFLMLHLVSKIVVQFESYIADYPPALRPRILAIPNVVEPAPARARTDQPNGEGRFRILAVGRLCDQKNYTCLIDAFAGLAATHPNWDLFIVGEGPMREDLTAQITTKGLQGRVYLSGETTRISDHYAAAHIFCMPSKWEGFPNALAEAMAHGLPAVGFAGCAGVRDLIKDGVNGTLAAGHGDPATLSRALAALMTDTALRVRLGGGAVLEMDQYVPNIVFPRWNALLLESSLT